MDQGKGKKIAVVGVSNNPDKWGYRIFRDLLMAGYQVEGINPSDGEILGKTIYRNLKAVSPIPEMVITIVPHQVTEKVVEECNELGIKEIWMQPGSESELAIEKAKNYGINITAHACFMIKQGLW
jgi:hypothetical protein